MQTLHLHGRRTIDGLSAESDARTELPAGRCTIENAEPIGTQSGFDGRDAWAADGTGMVRRTNAEEDRTLAHARCYVAAATFVSPGGGGAVLTREAPRACDGRTCDVLRVALVDEAPFEILIDRMTALPRMLEVPSSTGRQTTRYDDYHPVRGIRLPFRIRDDSGTFVAETAEADDAPPTAPLVMPTMRADDVVLEGDATSVPFDLLNDHIYVRAFVDGHGPYRFLLDTGATLLVDRNVARTIGGRIDGSFAISGFGKETANASFVQFSTLRIGAATIAAPRGTVFDAAPYFREVEGVPDAIGVLGYEIFARFVVTIDYAQRRLTLARPEPDAVPRASPSVASTDTTTVPFVFGGTTPVLSGTLDGIPTHFSVDTGSRAPVQIFTRFLNAHTKLRERVTTAEGIVGYGVGGAAYAALGRVHALTIGSGREALRDTNPLCAFGTRLTGIDASSANGANLGSQFLQRSTLVFDYAHERMTFAPRVGSPPPYDRSGLFLIARGDAFVVLDARPGTPAADAGIRGGDRIVAVDGRASELLRLPDVRMMLRAAGGTRVMLRLRSASGRERTVELTLRTYA